MARFRDRPRGGRWERSNRDQSGEQGRALIRQLIVAHDLGTSGDKASLHDADGRLIAAHTAHYATDFGPGGKAEQDPADWWEAFCSATRTLLSETGARPDEVACVVMSGQMMGAVLVDDADRAVRPALIWADTRAQAETRLLGESVGYEHGYRLLGHPIDATCSLAKLMWLRHHEPEAWARTTGVLLAKDYVTLRLTGRRCIDPSDASGTNAYDQIAGQWSDEMLAAAGIGRDLFPEVLPSASVAGAVSGDVSSSAGLREGTPVVVGGADGCTSALGVGLVAADSAAVATIGSSAWISVAADVPVRDPLMRTVTFDHVIPGHFVPLGAMQAAGAALDWFAATLGVSGEHALRDLVTEAKAVEAASDGLFFLPYILGERAPIWDSRVRGMFIGLSRHHGPAHLTRALLEGVAFNLYGTFRALAETVRPIREIDAVGGGARSDVWLQIMADTWGVPVRRRTIVDEANSLGAAVIGGKAIGLIDDWEAARSLSEADVTFQPDERRHAGAEEAYQRFTDVYERMKAWFR